MKILIFTLSLLISFASVAHVHDDWVIVHRVDSTTHELIHTATTHSKDYLSILTIDCDNTLTMHEFKTYIDDQRTSTLRYAIDDQSYKDVINYDESLGYRSLNVHDISPDAYQRISQGNILNLLVISDNGERDVYEFSLNGMNESYKSMQELCK